MTLLQKLREKTFFSSLSELFCKTVIQTEEEDLLLFLSYLFDISLLGYVSLCIEDNRVYPEPQVLLSEETSLDTETLDPLKRRIIEGSKLVPKEWLEETLDIETLSPQKPICRWKHFFYLQKHFFIETLLLSLVKTHTLPHPTLETEKLVAFLEEKPLSPEQKKGIINAFLYPLSVISGGPGTGKTYTAAYLVETYIKTFSEKRSLRIILTAPTGKAAFHLEQKLREKLSFPPNVIVEAMTLHSLLGIKENENSLQPKEMIEADLIIVDEASMMDGKLFVTFLMAKKIDSLCVLLGDAYQLPPVGMGSFFCDVVEWGIDRFSSELSVPHRFEKKGIYLLAEDLKKGRRECIDLLLQGQFENVTFHSWSHREKELSHFISRYYKTGLFSEGKILSCLRKGPYGVDALNKKIFSQLALGKKQEMQVPILITKNASSMNLYNGTMGTLQGAWENGTFHSKAKVFFPQRKESVPFFLLPPFEYGYALSVHKAQGSEFPHVLLILPEGSEYFGREILYTALTRAKKELSIIGKEETLYKMLEISSLKRSAFRDRVNTSR